MESLWMTVGEVGGGGVEVAARGSRACAWPCGLEMAGAVARRLPSALATLGAAAVPIGSGGTRGCGGGRRLPSAPVALGAAAVQEDDGSYRCRRP
uniref:Uncharacterized protein n=1 Tax=Oryza barthii TaxID=65489 RepID=A0A0D3ER52_9ORYZ